MTMSDLRRLSRQFVGFKIDPQIEVFTGLGHPSNLISVEYCKENNVLMFTFESEEGK